MWTLSWLLLYEDSENHGRATLRHDLKPHWIADSQPYFSAAADNRFAKTRAKILEQILKRDILLYLSRSAREPFLFPQQDDDRASSNRVMLCTSFWTSGPPVVS